YEERTVAGDGRVEENDVALRRGVRRSLVTAETGPALEPVVCQLCGSSDWLLHFERNGAIRCRNCGVWVRPPLDPPGDDVPPPPEAEADGPEPDGDGRA